MPTDDYIKRSDVLNTIHSVPPGNWSRARYMDAVERVPAADVEPVRNGSWIWDDEGFHCSECWFHAYGDTGEVLSGHYHYCPNCGAKMEAEPSKEADE